MDGARDAAGLDLIDNLDPMRISVFPAEADAIPLIDTNTCLPLSFIPLAVVSSFVLPGVLFAINAGRTHVSRQRNLLLALFASGQE